MYGKHVDSLNVYVKTGLNLPAPTWSKKGSQGRDWKEGDVDIVVNRGFNVSYDKYGSLTRWTLIYTIRGISELRVKKVSQF